MNYPLKSKSKNSYRLPAILVGVLFCVLVLLSFFFPKGTRTVLYFVAKPVWVVRDVCANSFSFLTQYFVFKTSLIADNKTLQDEVTALTLKQADYDILFKENDDLKTQFGRSNDRTRVIARVLSKPPRSPYDTFVIDAGSAEGISIDNEVYLSGNVLIGTVSSVTTHTSVVSLFSTADTKQEVVLERTGASFEIVGAGGANFTLEVPKETDIMWGDVFTYPSITPSIIGSVYYIDVNSQSSFKKIYIRMPGNVFQAKYVFVQKD